MHQIENKDVPHIFLKLFGVPCRCGVVFITTAQLHSTKPELRFCSGSNPTRGMLEIWDGEDLSQWSWFEIGLNVFGRSTIPQKQCHACPTNFPCINFSVP